LNLRHNFLRQSQRVRGRIVFLSLPLDDFEDTTDVIDPKGLCCSKRGDEKCDGDTVAIELIEFSSSQSRRIDRFPSVGMECRFSMLIRSKPAGVALE
jgi:hypothetical protein